MLEVLTEELRPGLLVGGSGRYRLERVVGQGGMGVVWAATHTVTGKACALKFLKASRAADPRSHERLLREARAACAVRHPSVAEVHDILELDSGVPFLVMDLLEGETLAAKLAREGKLARGAVAELLVPVVDAVAAAHEVGVVHRDLKPENVFLAVTRDRAVAVKVLDFGIAKLARGDATPDTPALTTTGQMVGTSFYMAPEQVYGDSDVDGRADVWALGVVLYEALTGVRPTQGETIGQVLKKITKEPLAPLLERAPEVEPQLARVIMLMLSRDRDARPSLGAVRRALLAIPGRRRRPSARWLLALVAVAGALVLVRTLPSRGARVGAEPQAISEEPARSGPPAGSEAPVGSGPLPALLAPPGSPLAAVPVPGSVPARPPVAPAPPPRDTALAPATTAAWKPILGPKDAGVATVSPRPAGSSVNILTRDRK